MSHLEWHRFRSWRRPTVSTSDVQSKEAWQPLLKAVRKCLLIHSVYSTKWHASDEAAVRARPRAELRVVRTPSSGVVTTGGRAGIQKGGAPLPASGVMLQHHRDANAAAAAPTRTTRARATAAAAGPTGPSLRNTGTFTGDCIPCLHAKCYTPNAHFY